jgi:flavodoxin I
MVYGTNSSNTYTTSSIVAVELRGAGFEVQMLSAAEAKPADLEPADLVIFGSCTWSKPLPDGHELQGQPQELFERFAESLKGKTFVGKQFAVFGLGDSRYTQFCAVADWLEKLVLELKGVQVASTLRIDGMPQRQEDAIKAWAKNVAQAYQAV